MLEMMNNNCGIYCWTNKVTRKKYIGQSVNLKNRKNSFLNFKYRYGGKLIDNARKKYNNKTYWEYTIIENNVPKEILNTKETFYINLFETTNRNKGYNILKENTDSLKKKIYQCDINNGDIIKAYDAIIETEEEYDNSSICACLKHKMSYYKNYIWLYQDEYENYIYSTIQKVKMVKAHYVSDSTREKMSKSRKGRKNLCMEKHFQRKQEKNYPNLVLVKNCHQNTAIKSVIKYNNLI